MRDTLEVHKHIPKLFINLVLLGNISEVKDKSSYIILCIWLVMQISMCMNVLLNFRCIWLSFDFFRLEMDVIADINRRQIKVSSEKYTTVTVYVVSFLCPIPSFSVLHVDILKRSGCCDGDYFLDCSRVCKTEPPRLCSSGPAVLFWGKSCQISSGISLKCKT
jgi:hypothetical protein